MGADGKRLGPLAVSLVALAVTGIFTAGALWIGGYAPTSALGSLLAGAFGSLDRFLSVTLVHAVPLTLTGLAVAVAFRAGVWNIGAEGQLYAGAVAGVWVGLHVGHLPAVIAISMTLLAAGAEGSFWALVPAVMRLRLGVGEVTTTILMNFVAIHLMSYVVRWPLQEARGIFPNTDMVGEAVHLPILVPGTRLHVGFALALALCLVLWAVFRFTAFGFRVRAVGASEAAARLSGRIDVRRIVLFTFLISGALAGLAGGVEISGRTFALYEGLSPGWGYTAIAVALLAGLNPLGVIFTGILFGALEGGAGAMQRDAGVPAAWVSAIEALVMLAVLAVDQAARRIRPAVLDVTRDAPEVQGV